MLDGKILRGLFEHERLKPANIRTNLWNKIATSVRWDNPVYILGLNPIWLVIYVISFISYWFATWDTWG